MSSREQLWSIPRVRYLHILLYTIQSSVCAHCHFYGRFYTLFNQNINKLVKRFTTFLLDYWALVLGHDGMHSMCVWSIYLLVP